MHRDEANSLLGHCSVFFHSLIGSTAPPSPTAPCAAHLCRGDPATHQEHDRRPLYVPDDGLQPPMHLRP